LFGDDGGCSKLGRGSRHRNGFEESEPLPDRSLAPAKARGARRQAGDSLPSDLKLGALANKVQTVPCRTFNRGVLGAECAPIPAGKPRLRAHPHALAFGGFPFSSQQQAPSAWWWSGRFDISPMTSQNLLSKSALSFGQLKVRDRMRLDVMAAPQRLARLCAADTTGGRAPI